MAEAGYWLRGRSLNLNLNQSSKAEEAKKSFKLPFVWATKTRTRNEEFSLIRRKNQRNPRRLVKIATSSSNKGRWNGKWTSEYIFSLQQLHLQDLVEDNDDGGGSGNGGGRDTQVSITLSIEKHASFGLSVNGRIIITSLTRKCCNCSSPYSRKIDTEFNVWVLQSSRHSNTTTHHLPEIGADDPSVIYVKAGGEADLDSLIQDAIRLATSVNISKFCSFKVSAFVSQDGEDPDVKTKALSYNQLTYMQHLDHEPVHTERPEEMIVYYKIARHYKWALDQLFYKHNFSRVIILEDDMEISPDFFDYFEAAVAFLESDKSIMAVSSWNDNGQKQFVQDPYMLYRSDFFPGLGWMLAKSTWGELSPKWPKAYWDDWLRLKETHKGRQFIRPEVCRTYNFGEHGSSLGQYFKQYLEPIKLNGVQVDWKSMDLNYLMEDKYVKHFADMVKNARPVCGTDDVLKECNIDCDVRI